MALIELQNLSYTYPERAEPALKNISLGIETGAWILLQGPTGSGKTTLLKCLSGAAPAFYGGTMRGTVKVAGAEVANQSAAKRVQLIGFVAQDPEAQSVYASVGHEVAFALENLGIANEEMQWRVAEALAMVGMSGLEATLLENLSGGERQRVALAAALVHQPQLLLLDEPTSQLDPVAADEWLDTLHRLNTEFGITLVMSEHRIDRAYPYVSEVAYMEDGVVLAHKPPLAMAKWLRTQQRAHATPAVARLTIADKAILSVREAKAWLSVHGRPQATRVENSALHESAEFAGPRVGSADRNLVDHAQEKHPQPLLQLSRVSAGYPNQTRLALDELDLCLYSSRVVALIGPNGAGKSTLLKVLSGLQKIVEGRVRGAILEAGGRREKDRVVPLGDARIGYLPQNPNDYLDQETVDSQLNYSLGLQTGPAGERERRVHELLAEFDLVSLQKKNPRDLSGGERLRVALACATARRPSLLLLDEPTRGFDAIQKRRLGEWLQRFPGTVVVATHDMEFVAEYADEVAFMHQGQVALSGSPQAVFTKALYFAPVLARVFRSLEPGVLTVRDAVVRGWAW